MALPPHLGGFGAPSRRIGRHLYLRTEPDDPPPEQAPYSMLLRQRRSREATEIRASEYTGLGLALHSGEAAIFKLAIDTGTSLSFVTASDPLQDVSGGRADFRVRLDGTLLFEHSVPRDVAHSTSHRVDIPARRGASLAFEGTGAPARTSFLAPALVPRTTRPLAARTEQRPNLIVFLADTFRADNLAFYGGSATQRRSSTSCPNARSASATHTRQVPTRCRRTPR